MNRMIFILIVSISVLWIRILDAGAQPESEVPPLTLQDVAWFGAADATYAVISDAQSNALNLMVEDRAADTTWWDALFSDFTVMRSVAISWASFPTTNDGLADVAVAYDDWIASIASGAESCLTQVENRAFTTCTVDLSRALVASVAAVVYLPVIREAIQSGTIQIVGLNTSTEIAASPIPREELPLLTVTPDTYTITGAIVLRDSTSVERDGDECYGTGGFSDMRVGTGATVRDGSGTVIGTGRIITASEWSPGTCEFTFEITGLPRSDFYVLEVSHRGELVYSFEEIEDLGWYVGLSLGMD